MAVDTMKVSEMAARILAIPGGPEPDPVEISLDTSTGLVTATDGLSSDSLQLSTQSGSTKVPTIQQYVAVPAGKYTTGDVKIQGDANLVAGNIKKDVSIFGVTGSYDAPTPDPVTISVSGGGLITATDGLSTETLQMATEAGYVITPGTSQQTAIAAQTYCTGAIRVAGDADLVASNIKKDVEIFGVTGTLKTPKVPFDFTINSSGTVYADDGVYTSVYSQPTVGGGTYNVLGSVTSADQVLVAGGKFLTSNVKIAQEPNFLSSNIKKGVKMWGTTGSYAPSLKTSVSGWCTALTDGRTGFRYTLSSPWSDDLPDLLFFGSRLVDPLNYLPDNSWCPGACSYRRDGSGWYVTGLWMYKENGSASGSDRANEWLNTNQLEILREDDDIIVLLKTWMGVPGSPVVTGNYHKCTATWL